MRRAVPGRVLRCLLALVALVAAGCAAARPPLKVVPGAQVETLKSAFSASASGGEGSGSARGYLLFKQPDRLHLALLSPFGNPLLELIGDGDAITCLVPGKMTAYQGSAADLPERGVLHQWVLMRWVLAPPPLPSPNGVTHDTLPDGRRETVYFYPDGLVQRKVTEDGEEVSYSDYRDAGGYPFPGHIELTGRDRARARITFDEPEVNTPLDHDAFTPQVAGYTVLPLTALAAGH